MEQALQAAKVSGARVGLQGYQDPRETGVPQDSQDPRDSKDRGESREPKDNQDL